jgi:hypothetical protein
LRGEEELPFWILAQLMTEDPKTAWGVAEAASDFSRGELIYEIGPEGFVLAMSRIRGFEEDTGHRCYLKWFTVKHIATISYIKTMSREK